ncbi:MAG: isoprenyl transferase [Pseudomonadota bacterium]
MKSEAPAIPRHIAIIMDGNGRWAKTHRLARIRGHRRGIEIVREIVTACRQLGVEVLTLYAFSEENWRRPAMEVTALMALLKRFLVSERKLFFDNGVRLRAIGDLGKLPKDVHKTLDETMEMTKRYDGLTLVLALSYGGREEIVRAVRSIAKRAADGTLKPASIDADTITRSLDTAEFPDPDLMIRTSGEYRTSNFLPWQAIYTELYVTPTLWPDFNREKLLEAIADFGRRERRFGMTSEQLPRKGAEQWHAGR